MSLDNLFLSQNQVRNKIIHNFNWEPGVSACPQSLISHPCWEKWKLQYIRTVYGLRTIP
jgi:hypothetical protein